MKKGVKHYEEFIEEMERAGVESDTDFKNWVGYWPSPLQRVLILARVKREKFYIKKEGKYRYRRVMRDKRGRFMKILKWTWHKVIRS